MPASPEQVAANRRNAARSTGPKTPEGKARSRFNAVKHGLRAESVLLPGEDSAHVTKRYVNLHAELKPGFELSEALVDRIALLTIRLERCERFDSAYYSDRVRHAKEGFDERQKAELIDLADRLGREYGVPGRLAAMPEGVDWMLGEWGKLRDDLDRPEGVIWSLNHLDRARDLRDITPSKVRAGRELILTEIVRDFFTNAGMVDMPEGLDDKGKVEWARLELLKIVDVEMTRLQGVRAAFDPVALEKERAASERLALFDPSKELVLARKYEAATERGLYKALKEFREAEATVVTGEIEGASQNQDESCEELGSFGNSAEVDPGDDEGPTPHAAEGVEFEVPEAPISAKDAPKVAIGRVGSAP